MKTHPDSPAYPCFKSTNTAGDEWSFTGGLTKRELFAAMAMQGLLANPQLVIKHDYECSIGEGDCPFDTLTETARIYADNLIEELDDND